MPPPRADPIPIHLLDGGLGTTLTSPPYSQTFNDSTPLWSSHLLLSSPSTLLAAQKSFADAGVDVLITATYQASFEGFTATAAGMGREGMGRREVEGLMRSAVGIARDAFAGTEAEKSGSGRVRKRGRVALSLGAYGATMRPSTEYSGAYDEARRSVEGLRRWHFERVGAFLPFLPMPSTDDEIGAGGGRNASVEGGDRWADEEEELKERVHCWSNIDLIAFETLPRIEEIVAAREMMGIVWDALHSTSSALVTEEIVKPFWISCVFPGEPNLLPDGSAVRDVVRAMIALNPQEGETLGGGKGVERRQSRPMGIGINCTRVGKVEGLIWEFEDAVRDVLGVTGNTENQGPEAEEDEYWPALVLYPDGTDGEVYNTTTKEWEVQERGKDDGEGSWDENVFEIARKTRERGFWKEIYVGGCCRTGPDEIRKLRERVDVL